MRESLAFGIWLVITLMPFLSAAIISGRTRLLGGFKLMFALVLGLAILTMNLIVAGTFGGINMWKVGLPQAVLLAVLLLACPEWKQARIELPKLKSALDPATVIGLAAGAIALFGLLIAVTRVAPRCDSLDLHLPMARSMLDHGTLQIPEGIRNATRPAGIALLYSWGLCGSSRLELLAAINLAYSLLLGLAAFNICRALGCGRRASIWAPVLMLGNYLLVDQIIVLYIDTALAAHLLAAYGFGLAYWRRPSLELLLGSALASGLAVGGKVQGVTYLPILLLPILVPYAGMTLSAAAREKARALAVWVVFAALLCGFWPARNLALTGKAAHEGEYTAAFTMRTALLFNLPHYARERGLPGFLRDAAGQTSWTTLASAAALLVLLCTPGGAASRLGIDRRLMAVFLAATLMSVALLLVHPCTARHFPDTELLIGGQLRYGIFTFGLMSICWVLTLAKASAWLPLLCIGLALPGSRTAATLGLASTGIIAVLVDRASNTHRQGG